MERLCNKNLVHGERKMIHHGYTNCPDPIKIVVLAECLDVVVVVCLMSFDVVVGLIVVGCMYVHLLSVAPRSKCLLSLVVGLLSVPLMSVAAWSECLLPVVVGWISVLLMSMAARS